MRVGPLGPSPAGCRRRPCSVPRALRSAPAQNAPPAPQSTATRSASSLSNSVNASTSARAAGPSTALRASGRSITIVATMSFRSIRIVIARSCRAVMGTQLAVAAGAIYGFPGRQTSPCRRRARLRPVGEAVDQEARMNVGVVFPQVEIGHDPLAIAEYAQAVEAMDYTHILVFDHVLGANPERPGGWKGPYTYRHAFHEPFVLFGFLAAATQRIQLVTGILILAQRQTALVAKQAAAVDVLSAGRLRLGVGVGWNHVEFESLNEDFSNRGKRAEEQIALMRALWTQDLVTFRG